MFGLNNKEKTVIKEIYICLQNEKKMFGFVLLSPKISRKQIIQFLSGKIF